uniref:Uncharacterized protein n=1 Tax=Rhizophora mucronata TaxID=61149 RepID=A0A2P2LUE4_RHIMU
MEMGSELSKTVECTCFTLLFLDLKYVNFCYLFPHKFHIKMYY